YHLKPDLLAFHIEKQAAEMVLHDPGLKIGYIFQPVRFFIGPGILQHDHAVFIVSIVQSKCCGVKTIEKGFFSFQISIKGLVEVKMIMTEVCKYPSCKCEA